VSVPRGLAPRTLDVSGLPKVALGRRNVSWLGNVLYMTIAGTIFALLIATYFYLRARMIEWPPGGHPPPALRYGLINAVVFLLSLAPARYIKVNAFKGRRHAMSIGLIVLIFFGALAIFFRIFEFGRLNCNYADNAYASAIWVLLCLHTGHLITEWLETLAVFGISLTDKMEGMRFADAGINTDYWYFVVATAFATDLVIYGTTRWL
jgi:heme/copper-type cytochrome/quinol oxidase subunit 3